MVGGWERIKSMYHLCLLFSYSFTHIQLCFWRQVAVLDVDKFLFTSVLKTPTQADRNILM